MTRRPVVAGPPVVAGEPGVVRGGAFAGRDARLYLTGQIISMVGDSSLWLAMGIWVKSLTGSSSAAALVWLAFIVGGVTGPLSAVLVDRLHLRRLLIVTNLAAAADVLLLLAVHHRSGVWLVYPVMFGYGVAYALLNAGSSAIVTPIFGSESRAGANAVLATAKQGMNLIAPVLGAGLFAVSGAVPVIVADAVTFVIAAGALSLVRARPAEPSTVRPAGGAGSFSAGIRHILRTPPLRSLVLAVAVAVLGLGLLEPVEFSVSSEGLHRPPAFLGVLCACQGVGALLGGGFAGRAVRVLGEVRTAMWGLAATAAGVALMAVPVLPVALAAFVLYGAALPWFVTAQQTQLQRLTPPETQGRAAGAAGLLIRSPQACGIMLGSAVIGVLGYQALIGVIALLTLAAAVWLLAVTPLTARRRPGP